MFMQKEMLYTSAPSQIAYRDFWQYLYFFFPAFQVFSLWTHKDIVTAGVGSTRSEQHPYILLLLTPWDKLDICLYF